MYTHTHIYMYKFIIIINIFFFNNRFVIILYCTDRKLELIFTECQENDERSNVVGIILNRSVYNNIYINIYLCLFK